MMVMMTAITPSLKASILPVSMHHLHHDLRREDPAEPGSSPITVAAAPASLLAVVVLDFLELGIDDAFVLGLVGRGTGRGIRRIATGLLALRGLFGLIDTLREL